MRIIDAKKFLSLLLIVSTMLSLLPIIALADISVTTFYIPVENFAQVSWSSETDDTILRSGTKVQSGGTNFTNSSTSYWSGVSASNNPVVGNNRAFYMRIPVPKSVTATTLNDDTSIMLEFTVQGKHNNRDDGHYVMTLFDMITAFPEDMSTMRAVGSQASADDVKARYAYKSTVANSNKVVKEPLNGETVFFDLTAYAKANPTLTSYEFIMLPNNSMLDFYSASEKNAQNLRPRVVVDPRSPLEAIELPETLDNGYILPITSKGKDITWSSSTSGAVANGKIASPDVNYSQTVTLTALIDQDTRDFQVTITPGKSNPNSIININGSDIDDANNRPGSLTFKGFGILNANSTSELVMDYKAQHPEKYWEMLEVLFGGERPLFEHIKMEMGNDSDNSTGAEPATKRFADEPANSSRSKGFQLVADVKTIQPDVKVSILRWSLPTWIANGANILHEKSMTNENDRAAAHANLYKWYKETMLDIYDRYGYVLDFINPDRNEQEHEGLDAHTIKAFHAALRNETDFPANWTEEDKAKYNAIRLIASDANNNGTADARQILGDSELLSILDITGFHYNTTGGSEVWNLTYNHDYEVWYNEGCAIFGTTEGSANSAGGTADNAAGTIGGFQSPLAMIDGFFRGFTNANARKSHYIFQPAIGSFYEGAQYSHKNLLSATDPWSGYIYYDESLYLLSHLTSFSNAGWESRADKTHDGIWRLIPAASAKFDGVLGEGQSGGYEHQWNKNGQPSYMTLASPDKKDFSVIAVNNSTVAQHYKITTDGLDDTLNGKELAVWETKARGYMVKKGNLLKDGDGYYVKIEPFSMVTITSLTDVEPERLPQNDVEGNLRTTLDSNHDGKGNNTSDDIIYADNFDYESEPDLTVYNPNTTDDTVTKFGTSKITDDRGDGYVTSYINSRGGGMRYAVVKNGAFEVVENDDGNSVLRQLLTNAPPAWNPAFPNLTVGDFRWMDYKASVDVDLSKNTASESEAYARINIRQQTQPNNDQDNTDGYALRLYKNGSWDLFYKHTGNMLASGSITPNSEHKYTLSLQGKGNVITAWIDDVIVFSGGDPHGRAAYSGRVKLACNWGITEFDNLRVETVSGGIPYATEFIDDSSSKITYSGTGWDRRSGNAGSANNFGRSLSKSWGGDSFSFQINQGTGFSILGDSGGYGGVTMNITVSDRNKDDVKSYEGVTGYWADGHHREMYMLSDLDMGDYIVQVTIVSGNFVMDGLMILADRSDRNESSIDSYEQITLEKIFSTDINAINLPKSIKVSGWIVEEGKGDQEFTDKDATVVWDALPELTGKEFMPIAIMGTATYEGITARVSASVKQVIPGNLVYYIDSGTANSGSDHFDNLIDTLKGSNSANVSLPLNTVSDQAVSSGSWGYATATPRNTARDEDYYVSLVYGNTNAQGATFTYTLPLTETGTYHISMGFYEAWNGRTSIVTAKVGNTDLGELGRTTVSGIGDTATLWNIPIIVDEPNQTLTLTFTAGGNQAACVSWIMLTKDVADRIHIELAEDIYSLPYESVAITNLGPSDDLYYLVNPTNLSIPAKESALDSSAQKLGEDGVITGLKLLDIVRVFLVSDGLIIGYGDVTVGSKNLGVLGSVKEYDFDGIGNNSDWTDFSNAAIEPNGTLGSGIYTKNTAKYGTSYALNKTVGWANYILEADVTFLTFTGMPNSYWPSASLAGRLSDSLNGYKLLLSPSAAEIKIITGGWAEEATLGESVDMDTATGTTRRIKLIFDGSEITFYVNGVKCGTVSDTTNGSGHIGIQTYEATAFYDNIKITEIKHSIIDELRLDAPATPAFEYPPQRTYTASDIGHSGTIVWEPEISEYFDADTSYTATITLTAEEGYEFSTDIEDNITNLPDAQSVTVSREDNKTVTVIITYAKTADRIESNTYYVDSVGGDDTNDGLSENSAWKTMSKVNDTTFNPGDLILFKAESVWDNTTFQPKGKGTPARPIVVDAYGDISDERNKPLINTNQSKVGNISAGILVRNVEYWEINNLQITNKSSNEFDGGLASCYGVYICADNYGTMNHIYVRNLYIHDIHGKFKKANDEGTGIFFDSKGPVLSKINHLRIENNHLERVVRNGIGSIYGFDYKDWIGPPYDGAGITEKPYRHSDIIIRNNLLEAIAGDGIKAWGCDGALIEYNTIRGSQMGDIVRGGSSFGSAEANGASAGIWPFDSENVVIQYNEVSGVMGTMDGQAFDIDFFTTNTIIQYNYSHDNAGGFLLLCCPGWAQSSGNVVRYNISQNDGSAPGWNYHLQGRIIQHGGGNTDTQIYNNTFYVGPDKAGYPLLSVGEWDGGVPKNARYTNNVFIVESTSLTDFYDGTASVFNSGLSWKNNVFMGEGFRTGNLKNKMPSGQIVMEDANPLDHFYGAGHAMFGMDTARDAYTLKIGSSLQGRGAVVDEDTLVTEYHLGNGAKLAPGDNKYPFLLRDFENYNSGKDFSGAAVDTEAARDIGAVMPGEDPKRLVAPEITEVRDAYAGVTVSFTPIEGATGYKLIYGDVVGFGHKARTITSGTNDTTFIVKDIDSAGEYFFAVCATDEDGDGFYSHQKRVELEGLPVSEDLQYEITSAAYGTDGKLSVSFSCKPPEESAWLLIVGYKEDGSFYGLMPKNINGTGSLSGIEFGRVEGGSVWIYIWSSLNSLRPVSDGYLVP